VLNGEEPEQRGVDGHRGADRAARHAVERRRHPEAADEADGIEEGPEEQVLALICEGLGNAQIAERLGISEKTVRNHVSNLFDKLGVWTRAQAIVFARDRAFRG